VAAAKAGEAGIDEVPACVNDARIRQREMDEAGKANVIQHLVGDAFGFRGKRPDARDRAGLTNLDQAISGFSA
jgi:hypothetical protein